MKTVRFIEYYLPNSKIEKISDIGRYTRDELYRNIYTFLEYPGYTKDYDLTYKLGYSPVFTMSDMEKVHHDLEMSDESYDVILNIIKKNKEINLQNAAEMRSYNMVLKSSHPTKEFNAYLLPNSQRKLIQDAFDFSIGTIKRGSKYMSFIYSVSILVEGEWLSVKNENKYLLIK